MTARPAAGFPGLAARGKGAGNLDRHHRELTEGQQRWLAGLSFAAFLLLSLLAAWVIGRPMIRLARTPELFRAWVDTHGLWGRLLFVGMVVLQVVIAIIPGEPLEIGAGYAFGFWEGTLLCVLGITIGSVLVFALVRRFGVRLVEVFFPKNKIRSLRFLRDNRRRDLLIFLVMFIPGTPKDLLSYFVGLTEIRFSRWVWIAMLARIPSIVTSTAGGAAVGAVPVCRGGVWRHAGCQRRRRLGVPETVPPKAGAGRRRRPVREGQKPPAQSAGGFCYEK